MTIRGVRRTSNDHTQETTLPPSSTSTIRHNLHSRTPHLHRHLRLITEPHRSRLRKLSGKALSVVKAPLLETVFVSLSTPLSLSRGIEATDWHLRARNLSVCHAKRTNYIYKKSLPSPCSGGTVLLVIESEGSMFRRSSINYHDERGQEMICAVGRSNTSMK